MVTIGKIEAGSTHNVIPETARLLGTMRTLSPATRVRVQAGIRRFAEGIAAAHGARAGVSFERGYPVTLCDARAVTLGRQVAESLFGGTAWRMMESPVMGAEDFAYVLEKVPGAMFFLGAAAGEGDPAACCGLHSNRMVLDESVMARGSALLAGIAERFLSEGFGSV